MISSLFHLLLTQEQAGIVFVPLSTDAILPVPLTLPHPPTPRPPVATKAPLAAPQKPRKERRQPNIAQTSTARSKFRLRLRHLARQHAVATFVHTSPPLRHRGERHRRREAHTLLRSLCGRGGLAESVA
ncbi:hypothetical protein BLNAU_13226 [Blattamonas nauphoetae]|uniref:Uncharacterized protein n=1 Tax=Blattamonas nauphoetae TaxID=2049346 RepID=A0ABQ9XIJ5_9EUKA|nr:hypothetical protein BLNAU_13226 [Blattamonas nauphoetae]